jgi:hypothetical protein
MLWGMAEHTASPRTWLIQSTAVKGRAAFGGRLRRPLTAVQRTLPGPGGGGRSRVHRPGCTREREASVVQQGSNPQARAPPGRSQRCGSGSRTGVAAATGHRSGASRGTGRRQRRRRSRRPSSDSRSSEPGRSHAPAPGPGSVREGAACARLLINDDQVARAYLVWGRRRWSKAHRGTPHKADHQANAPGRETLCVAGEHPPVHPRETGRLRRGTSEQSSMGT